MKIKDFASIILLIILGFVLSCKKETSNNETIREEVFNYVDSFFIDMQLRGIKTIWTKDLLQIDFFPDSKDGNGGVANGKYIAFNKDLWINLPNDRRKSLVYHELAHSILNREHTNQLLPNGEYKSIMRGGSKILPNKSEGTRFKGFREKYYIDELFDTTTVIPNWALKKFSLQEIKDTLSSKYFTSTMGINHSLNTTNNFKIECNVYFDSISQKEVGIIWNKKLPILESFLIQRGIPTIHILETSNYRYDDYGHAKSNLKSKYYLLTIEKKGSYIYYYIDNAFYYYKEFDTFNFENIEFRNNSKSLEYIKIIEF